MKIIQTIKRLIFGRKLCEVERVNREMLADKSDSTCEIELEITIEPSEGS